MDTNKKPDLMQTILSTPQPRACSTVRVKKTAPRLNFDLHTADDPSFLMENKRSISSALLEHQRVLANESLLRLSHVAALPSKYLKRSDFENDTASSSIGAFSEGTISDSDLVQTPKNTSTPRESASSLGKPSVGSRLSLHNLEELASKLKSNMSLDNFLDEFNRSTSKLGNIQVDSAVFIPGEEAESKLRVDEMSWRKKNDFPIKESLLQESRFDEDMSLSKMSVGGYFKQRSDDLSDLKEAISPEKEEPPIALIDITTDVPQIPAKKLFDPDDKSLSVSAIARFLADNDGTPRRLVDQFENYIADKGKKSVTAAAVKSKTDSSDDSCELPVSKNSSYTSNYSDNEALKHVADKENRNTLNIRQNKPSPRISTVGQNSVSPNDPGPTSSSSRSSSSLSSLPDGKLPIESTRNELIWGCVKVDKCVTQEFLIRNRSSKSVRLQCSVSTHDFKIRKENRPDSDHLNAAKFVLRGQESRSIVVSFVPTKLGACIDEINFLPLDSNLKQLKKQCIRLFGYGGHANVSIQNITKDISGKYLLSLGKLENRPVLEQTFIMKNSGCLTAFAYISFRAKQIFVSTDIRVVPNIFLLAPNEQKVVTVVYSPSACDIKVLQQNLNSGCITNIGSLEVMTGAEVNRFRLRRLCRKCAEKNLPIDGISKDLNEQIKGEITPCDIVRFKESPANLKEVVQLFNHDEIVLMVEQDPDQTLVPHYPDDSAMFQTICHESTAVVMENTVIAGSCRLEPSSIIFTLPHKTEDILCLISEANRPLHFETTTYPKGLAVVPSSGRISPGDTIVLRVKVPPNAYEKAYKVVVYVDNEKFEADVKVLVVNSSRANFLG